MAKSKKKTPAKKTRQTLNAIEDYISRIRYHRFIDPLDTLVKAGTRFFFDGSILRSHAIAYALVLSIIPLLTVVVRFAAIDNEEIRAQISRLLSLYGITESQALLEVLDSILSRANTIAGIGLVFMIYSATNLLRHLEDTANNIFKAPARPYFFRLTIFVASLILIPAVTILYSGLLRPTLALLKPEAYTAFSIEAPTALRSDGLIRISKDNTIDIKKKIDFFAPNRDWIISNQKGLLLNTDKSGVILPADARPGKKTLNNLKFFSSAGSLMSAITEDGLLVYSLDNGQTWDFRTIWSTDGLSVRKPIVEDLSVFSDRIVILLTNRDESSLISYYPDSGGIYKPVHHRFNDTYRSLNLVPTGYVNPDDPYEIRDLALMIGGNGGYRISYDRGYSAGQHIPVAGKDITGPIEHISRLLNGDLVFLDRSGTVMIRTTESTVPVYPSLRLNQKPSVNGMHISATGFGMIYGRSGFLRVTLDGGKNWHKTNIDEGSIDFLAHYADDKTVYLAGTDEFLSSYRFDGIDEKADNGYGVAKFEEIYQYKADPWLGIFYNLLFIGNIYILFLAFLAFIYRSLPNKAVSFKAAMSGAVVSSLGLSIFAWIFRTLVASFSNVGYIYGVWVAIPLGMLIILATVQIVLFGFQVAAIVDEKRRKTENLSSQ